MPGEIKQRNGKKMTMWSPAVGLRFSTRGFLDRCRGPTQTGTNDGKCLTQRRRLSQDHEEIQNGIKAPGWKEHTWSIFIARAEEEEAEVHQGKLLLSTFQRDKFIHFFYHVLDVNNDHVISHEDFDGLNDRVRHYMDWSINDIHFLTLKEVHTLFIQYFLRQAILFIPKKTAYDFCDFKCPDDDEEEQLVEKESISIDEWIDVWGETVGKARKMDDLPMWLQYYPKTLFDTINRSGSGIISKKELKLFYTAFLDAGKMGGNELDELTEKSYSAMTSNGDIELTFHMYKLSFLNFLLGQQPNGPGQWIFGAVMRSENAETVFPIDYR